MKRWILFFIILLFCTFFTFGLSQDKNNQSKTVIRFSSWGSKSETDILKTFISDFENENPDIKIDFIHIPQNYYQKLQLLFASGLEPDVIFINNQYIQMYINAGLLENLSNYFDNLDNEFYKEALDCFRFNEKIFAIPRDISTLVIYYNKDIFKKLNIKMPEKINNIFELRELSKKVTTKNNFGINYEENPLFWVYYLASNGGGIISDDLKEIIINNEKSIQALNLYADMINKDHTIPSKADMGSMTSAQMFINGKLAMYLSGRWMTPKFRQVINFDWDVVNFPSPNKVYIDSSGFAISKNSKHKNEAVKLIKYFSTAKAHSKFSQEGLIIPANINADIQNNNQRPKNYSIYKTMLNNVKPTPVNENYSTIIDIVKEKTENIFNGNKRAEEVFDEKTIMQLKLHNN